MFPAFPLTVAPGGVTWARRAIPQPLRDDAPRVARGRGGARKGRGGGCQRRRAGAEAGGAGRGARRIMGCGGGMALGA